MTKIMTAKRLFAVQQEKLKSINHDIDKWIVENVQKRFIESPTKTSISINVTYQADIYKLIKQRLCDLGFYCVVNPTFRNELYLEISIPPQGE